MNAPHDLHDRLAHEAEDFFRRGGTVLELDRVLDRAGEIRRGRRMRATMLMAACVLAIAVPTALVATDRDHRGTQPTPAHRERAHRPDHSAITLRGLDTGAAPATGYLSDGTWHGPSPSGQELHVAAKGRVTDVARAGTGIVVAVSTDNGGIAEIITPNPDSGVPGERHLVEDLSGGFAAATDSDLVGFVGSDGTPTIVQDGRTYRLPQVPADGGYDTVAAFGPDCSVKLDFESCGAWVTTRGRKTGTWESWSSGVVRRVDPGLRWVTAVADGTMVAGVTDVRDDLSTCSKVESFGDLKPLWTVCGYQLTAFSPDAAHVLAKPDGDGLGPRSVAVYDADGKQLWDLAVQHDGFIGRTVWEDDDHVLATVFEQGRWAVVRIALDGSRELAVRAVEADMTEPPFVLPTR